MNWNVEVLNAPSEKTLEKYIINVIKFMSRNSQMR